MPREFTNAQKQAIDTNALDVCVSAGAGSGKTGVLVERFVRIVTESLIKKLPVSERASVSEIVVVTFTDRATREMKSRIVQAFDDLGLIDERRQLETAYISTIHGLCSRLLKENPFESGVDPEFIVVDETGTQRMIRKAFDGVIEDAYQTQNFEIIELVNEVINAPGFRGLDLDGPPLLALEVEKVLRKLRGAGVAIEELQRFWQTGRSSDADVDPVQALLHPIFVELAACIDELRSMATRAAGIAGSTIASILALVARMRRETDAVTRIGNVQKLSIASVKAQSRLESSQADFGLRQLLSRINAACDGVSVFYGISTEIESASMIACRRFAGLICKVWASYSASKQQAGLLDNDDLLIGCVNLLDKTAEVRRRYQRQFRHLMIDEFQDTDLLQMRIVALLHIQPSGDPVRHMSASSETDVSSNSLFIVGDIQQSIYGFRNADPQIFRRIESRFRENSQGFYVELSDNFRSRPEILQVVQTVFEAAWREEPTPFVPLRSAAEFEGKLGPSIELLTSNNLARREYVHIEADAIAKRLKAIVERADSDDNTVKITARNDLRCGMPVGYGDIALLLRGLTDIRVYEEAFARNGVPALVTAGGRGYYGRYEIQDLLSVLTLLDSPSDDAALLTALRSPFVGVDVDTIYRLAITARNVSPVDESSRERGSLYSALPHLLASADLPESERAKIEPFLAAVDTLKYDVDRVPVGRLMDRVIFQTNYDMRLICRPDGRRKLANVRKLVQIALAEPSLTVCEFVSRMKDLRVLADREGDAPTAEEGAGVVRLMTIHSAKGLEFPVVVLPDLSRGLVAPETGLFTCDPVLRVIGARTRGEPDLAYRAITAQRQEADRA